MTPDWSTGFVDPKESLHHHVLPSLLKKRGVLIVFLVISDRSFLNKVLVYHDGKGDDERLLYPVPLSLGENP